MTIAVTVYCYRPTLCPTVETVDDTSAVFDKARLIENRDFCLPHLHSTPLVRRVPVGILS